MTLLRTIASLIVTVVIAGCGGESHPESTDSAAPSAKVSVAAAQKEPNAAANRIMGTVIARNRAELETKVQGRIARITVALGSRVRAGELMAELDTREFEARVRQARAAYEQAARDLSRFESLHAQQAVTDQEYDGAKARAAMAEAALAEAEAMLSYARITAPFSGVVTAKSFDVGDLATPGRPLFVLQDESELRFVATIPESYVDLIAVGDSVAVEFARAGERVAGWVEEISPGADPLSRSYEAKISLDGVPGLRPGQFGTLLLPSGGDSRLWIPATALVRRGQLELVCVAGEHGVVDLRLVRTGAQNGDRIEILAGLAEDEYVIVSDPHGLKDGDRIEIAP
jgi:RND family efflux transporter MFP subunit